MIPLVNTWHLFGEVYVKNCYRFIPFKSTRKYYEYYHRCIEPLRVALIEESGTCTHCNTYIAPYKKLETMVALKNLTS